MATRARKSKHISSAETRYAKLGKRKTSQQRTQKISTARRASLSPTARRNRPTHRYNSLRSKAKLSRRLVLRRVAVGFLFSFSFCLDFLFRFSSRAEEGRFLCVLSFFFFLLRLRCDSYLSVGEKNGEERSERMKKWDPEWVHSTERRDETKKKRAEE